MKIRLLLPILQTLALFTTSCAQTLDKAKLGRFLTDLEDCRDHQRRRDKRVIPR